ncbi:MAG: DUF1207 domain-containing protein [Nitrospirales bacterium]
MGGSSLYRLKDNNCRKRPQEFCTYWIFIVCITFIPCDGWTEGGDWFSSPTAQHTDCRYQTSSINTTRSEGDLFHSIGLPDDDVFTPLLAAPKEPKFVGGYQRVRFRDANESLNVGIISAGGTFGLWGHRHEINCDGLQFSLFGAIFSQFNLDADSTDLINSDFQVGFPLTWRRGSVSTRLRVYHQSSHVGDEFLLRNPGFNRVNLGFEAVEVLVSLDPSWWRVYAGGSYLIRRSPALDRGVIQWGLESRAIPRAAPILSRVMEGVLVAPVLGADFQSFQQFSWNLNTSIMGGFEWSRVGSTRRYRLLLSYYRGHNPFGQFFDQNIQTYGIGLYIEI